MGKSNDIFNDDDFKVDNKLLSITSLNPFACNNSSSRLVMQAGHFSQILTIEHGENSIIQTGIERQFVNNTFSKKLDDDIRILSIIPRYRFINNPEDVPEYLIITESLNTGEIDYINVPCYHKLHQYFGFKYNRNPISKLHIGGKYNKGTIFAETPTTSKDSSYRYGINANVVLATLPDVAEDGVIVSESLVKKMSYRTYETKIASFGANSFPLNLYGDKTTYKPFPSIGESVREDGVLLALREFDNEDNNINLSLSSINDIMNYDMLFDNTIYVKRPEHSKVVDIKIYHTPKYKKDSYTGINKSLDIYIKGLRLYYQEILDCYEEIKKTHFSRYHNNDVLLSEKLTRLITEAYCILNKENKLNYSFRNETLDLYHCEFVIETLVTPGIGSKQVCRTGAKGVIIDIWKDEDMPTDIVTGDRADIIMDSSSIVSRMNPGRLYEHYFNGMSRNLQHMLRNKYSNIDSLNNTQIEEAFDLLLGLFKIIDNKQYIYYSNTNLEQKKEILKECIEEEVFIYFTADNVKTPYQIVNETKGTIYEPIRHPLQYNYNGKVFITKENIRIAPLYTMLLNRTGDNYLSVASSRTNHFGFPIGMSSVAKFNAVSRFSPVKIMSESEGRIFASYIDNKVFLPELKDRANSLITHEEIYRNILEADNPTDIEQVIDRSLYPYGTDISLELINHIFNSGGIKISYQSDSEKNIQ